MCPHARTHTLQRGGVNSRESTTSFDQVSSPSSVSGLFVWQPAPLSDPLSGGWGASEAAGLVHEWTVEDAGVPPKEQSLS